MQPAFVKRLIGLARKLNDQVQSLTQERDELRVQVQTIENEARRLQNASSQYVANHRSPQTQREPLANGPQSFFPATTPPTIVEEKVSGGEIQPEQSTTPSYSKQPSSVVY